MIEEKIEVLFKPFQKQIEFIEAAFSEEYDVILYGGAIRGGKSFGGIGTLLLLCKKYPKSKWAIVRDNLQTLKRNTIPSFDKICPKGFIKSINHDTQTVTFKNGSQIIFFGENFDDDKELNRWRGLEVNGFLLEEVNELQEQSFFKAIERAGSHIITPQPKPLILATCNPSSNWVKKLFYEPSLKNELPKRWKFIYSKISDNPFVPEEYKTSLKVLPKIDYDRFVEGDWSSFAVNNPFAYAFNEKNVSECEVNESEFIYLSFDFNVDPITCIAAQHYDNTIHVIREFRLENSDIYQLCERIKVEYPISTFVITGDATGANRSALTKGNLNYYTVIREELRLSSNQMKVPTVNPAISDSRVLINSLLQNYKVKIDPRYCPFLIEDLKFVEVDNNGDVKKKEAEAMKRNHLLDCFRYHCNTHHKNFLKFASLYES